MKLNVARSELVSLPNVINLIPDINKRVCFVPYSNVLLSLSFFPLHTDISCPDGFFSCCFYPRRKPKLKYDWGNEPSSAAQSNQNKHLQVASLMKLLLPFFPLRPEPVAATLRL